MQIFIKTLTGTITLVVQPTDTINSIKHKIEQKENLPFEVLNLKCSGRQLDDDRTLSDNDIQGDSTLNLDLHIDDADTPIDW